LALAAVVGITILGAIFYANNGSQAGRGGEFAYAVGDPGPGEPAPQIRLPSTDGGVFDLTSLQGETVLLYFQEGLMCQPCWDQITDIETNRAEFEELGIDKIVSITTDPLDLLQQKVADQGITIPVLSDPALSVSRSYETNQYGMMGEGYNGHSFILIDENGTIQWRADYGGSPNYTMYVPVNQLVADLREGTDGGVQ
jgi:peroxiredoxin